MTTQYWLVKSEPETYSWETFLKEGRTAWTGVRNYAARLHLNAMRADDQVLFYHSGEAKSIIGLARVTKAAFADPTAEEPGWVAVELAAVAPLKKPVPLALVKSTAALKDIALVRISRLSVQPVKPAEFKVIMKLGGGCK